jgi:hypothetical protein
MLATSLERSRSALTIIIKVSCHIKVNYYDKALLTVYCENANLPFVEIIAAAVKIGTRSSISVSADRPGGTSPNQLRCAVASVKVTDTLKLVEPPIAAISLKKHFI